MEILLRLKMKITYSRVNTMNAHQKMILKGINPKFHTYSPWYIHVTRNSKELTFVSDEEYIHPLNGLNIGVSYTHDIEPSDNLRELVEHELFLKEL